MNLYYPSYVALYTYNKSPVLTSCTMLCIICNTVTNRAFNLRYRFGILGLRQITENLIHQRLNSLACGNLLDKIKLYNPDSLMIVSPRLGIFSKVAICDF